MIIHLYTPLGSSWNVFCQFSNVNLQHTVNLVPNFTETEEFIYDFHPPFSGVTWGPTFHGYPNYSLQAAIPSKKKLRTQNLAQKKLAGPH